MIQTRSPVKKFKIFTKNMFLTSLVHLDRFVSIEPDTNAIMEVIQKTISTELASVLSLLEQMSCFHPSEPHWYLAILGVELIQQKKGYGSALIQQALNHCDRHKQVAYLESSNITDLPFYEKHGFEVTGTIQAGNSPVMFLMVRYPQNAKV